MKKMKCLRRDEASIWLQSMTRKDSRQDEKARGTGQYMLFFRGDATGPESGAKSCDPI